MDADSVASGAGFTDRVAATNLRQSAIYAPAYVRMSVRGLLPAYTRSGIFFALRMSPPGLGAVTVLVLHQGRPSRSTPSLRRTLEFIPLVAQGQLEFYLNYS